MHSTNRNGNQFLKCFNNVTWLWVLSLNKIFSFFFFFVTSWANSFKGHLVKIKISDPLDQNTCIPCRIHTSREDLHMNHLCGCMVSVTPDRTSAPLFGGWCKHSHLIILSSKSSMFSHMAGFPSVFKAEQYSIVCTYHIFFIQS